MNDREAIERYDAGGTSARGRFPGIRWPDVALTEDNLRRLFEGVLEARVNVAAFALGDDIDSEALAGRVEEAWRLDAMQVRFAPEGVFVRAAFTVLVRLASADPEAEPEAEVSVAIGGEICLSYVELHHVRPFVDFMGGQLRLLDPEPVVRTLEPYTWMVEPDAAVAWGLNGARHE